MTTLALPPKILLIENYPAGAPDVPILILGGNAPEGGGLFSQGASP
jgi:hypothetical protein